jgi:hypothetical protein
VTVRLKQPVDVDRIVASTDPIVIGVRHHSPAMAAAMAVLLERSNPTAIALELPADLQQWIVWLGHDDLRSPVALSVTSNGIDGTLAFYPFADFSPELAAIRWAAKHNVPVFAIDLPVGVADAPPDRDNDVVVVDVDVDVDVDTDVDSVTEAPVDLVVQGLMRGLEADDFDDLWDRMVEATAPGQDPEELRRAGIRLGATLRDDETRGAGVQARDRAREAHMCSAIDRLRAEGHARIVAVVGSFHAAALVEPPISADPASKSERNSVVNEPVPTREVASSLVPYRFDLLDSRSGYPAGIRDPQWQQSVFLAAGNAAEIDSALTAYTVDIARRLRERGHVVSTPDAQEAVRIARDLAILRGLPAPARRELIEGVQTAYVHGEPLGRGRIVATTMETVLVGRASGILPKGAPRTGLAVALEAELRTLRLPAKAGDDALDVRLEPWRSELDRNRVVALRRLTALAIPYGEIHEAASSAYAMPVVQSDADIEALTSRWKIAWEPSTDAMIAVTSIYGTTLQAAVEGILRYRLRVETRDEANADVSVVRLLNVLHTAADCVLVNLVSEIIGTLIDVVASVATFGELLATLSASERLISGLVPGLTLSEELINRLRVLRELAFTEALPRVESIVGSDDPSDVSALAMLVARLAIEPAEPSSVATASADAPQPAYQGRPTQPTAELHPGRLRVLVAIDAMASDGSPLMQGAAHAAALLLGRVAPEVIAEVLGAWVVAADSKESKAAISRRLFGFFLHGSTAVLSETLLRKMHFELMRIEDQTFLTKAPTLREGFSALSTADRRRVLNVVGELFALDQDSLSREVLDLAVDPTLLNSWMAADVYAQRAVDALHLSAHLSRQDSAQDSAQDSGHASSKQTGISVSTNTTPTSTSTENDSDEPLVSAGAINALDRWRLILGQERKKLTGLARRAGTALDELYGRGNGEGASGFDGDAASDGGGNEASFPTGRMWADELLDVFGTSVREEILGRAAANGRFDAALLLNPEEVQPSVALLTQVLSLRGSLNASQLQSLRKIVDRVVRDLVKELATQVRPALTGAVGNRTSRRGRGPLDLDRTISDNLRNTRPSGMSIERFWFRERNRRTMDWRVVFVVDVSGSMEASMIYSAMMAAIVNALPAVTSHFIAFSTEVIDFSGLVDDPLGLLLEVSVGGGTDIGKAMAFARTLVKVPSRTLMIVVSDFEEGGSVNRLVQEVRTLSEAGVKLLGLAALDNSGAPRFERRTAELVAGAGMDVAALTPLELARWVGERIR